VRRMVEAIDEGEQAAAVDELFAPRAARRVKRLFAEFRLAFPDWHEEIVELVAEGTRWWGASGARGRTWARFWGTLRRANGWRWRSVLRAG